MTVCFVLCGAYAVYRLARGGRVTDGVHVAMAVAMLVMVWIDVPRPVAVVAGVAFLGVAVVSAYATGREASWGGLHHTAMAAVMGAMWLAPGTHHQMSHTGHSGHGSVMLTIGAAILVVTGVTAILLCRRHRWLEAVSTLGMVAAALAMAAG